jgi:hypothetical protein
MAQEDQIPPWDPTEPQHEVLEAKEQIIGMKGGIRSGKSHMWHMRLTMECLAHPGLMALVVRKHLPTLRDTAFHYVLSAPSNPWNWTRLGIVGAQWADPMEILVDNGSLVHFRSTYQDGREDTTKFGSTDYGLIIMEEADEIGEKMYNFLVGRLSQRYPEDVPRKMLLSFNPPLRSHWLHQNFADFEKTKPDPENGYRFVENPAYRPRDDGKKQSRRLITFDIEHNRENLPEGYIDSLYDEYDEEWVKRYMRGDWGVVLEGTPVLPEYRESHHVSKSAIYPAPNFPVLVGWDAHPIGIYIGVAWLQLIGSRMHLFKSQLFRLGKDGSAREAIKAGLRLTKSWFPDHAGRQVMHFGDPSMVVKERLNMLSIADIMQDEHNITLELGAISHAERREEMADWLSRSPGGRPAFVVAPGAETEHIREGLAGGYCYPGEAGDYITKKEPRKNEYSHEVEAAMYVLTGLGILDWKKRVRQASAETRKQPAGTWMGA